MHKRKNICLLILLGFILTILIAWIVKPLIIKKSIYWIADEIKDTTLESEYKNLYRCCPDLFQLPENELVFPSEEITDYCRVVIGIDGMNISPLSLQMLKFDVDWTYTNPDIITAIAPVFPSQQGHRFSKVQERDMTSFLVYRNGRTDEEIVSELQNVEVILTYETLIKSYSKRVKLGDLSYQLMDDWYSYPKGWAVPVDEIPEGAVVIE